MTTLTVACLLSLADAPPPTDASTVRSVWLADLDPARVQLGTAGRFVFIPDSRPAEADGCVVVDAAGPTGVLRTVQCARGEADEGLDVAAPISVEGILVVIRHPARGEFRAVVELQVREARRVR